MWVEIDDLYYEGSFNTLRVSQLELTNLYESFVQLVTNSKELRTHDIWGVFEKLDYNIECNRYSFKEFDFQFEFVSITTKNALNLCSPQFLDNNEGSDFVGLQCHETEIRISDSISDSTCDKVSSVDFAGSYDENLILQEIFNGIHVSLGAAPLEVSSCVQSNCLNVWGETSPSSSLSGYDQFRVESAVSAPPVVSLVDVHSEEGLMYLRYIFLKFGLEACEFPQPLFIDRRDSRPLLEFFDTDIGFLLHLSTHFELKCSPLKIPCMPLDCEFLSGCSCTAVIPKCSLYFIFIFYKLDNSDLPLFAYDYRAYSSFNTVYTFFEVRLFL